jgi:hypothetical protein
LGRDEGDAEGNFGGVDGAGSPGMVGQFLGHGLGEFGTEMPEKRVPPGTEQAHEAVANQNESGESEKLFGDEVVFHKISARERVTTLADARLQRYAQHCGQV